jgi:hypothetical protein
MAINHLHSSSDATSSNGTVTSGTIYSLFMRTTGRADDELNLESEMKRGQER